MTCTSLWAGFRPAVLGALLALVVLAAPASAAPPTAQNYTISAAPSGTLDALAQDSDPDGDAMTLSGHTQPAHGTASCSSLGACLYTATRATRAPTASPTPSAPAASEATGTITVNVSASGGTGAFQVRDDDVATRFGHGDRRQRARQRHRHRPDGRPRRPTRSTAPSPARRRDLPLHARAPATAGSDGFVYTATDAAQRHGGAPPCTSSSPPRAPATASRSPAAPTRRAAARRRRRSWGVSVASSPAASPATSCRPSPCRDERDARRPARDQRRQPAAGLRLVRHTDGGALHAKAGERRAARRGRDEDVPASAAPDQPGHRRRRARADPRRLEGLRLLPPQPADLGHLRRPRDRRGLPGLPEDAQTGFGTTDINGPAVVSGSKMYVAPLARQRVRPERVAGLFCWDADTNSTCGLTIVDRVARPTTPAPPRPCWPAGSCGSAATPARLYCVDPATGAACAAPRSPPASDRRRAATTSSRTAPACSSRAARRARVVRRRDAGRDVRRLVARRRLRRRRLNLVNQHDAGGAADRRVRLPRGTPASASPTPTRRRHPGQQLVQGPLQPGLLAHRRGRDGDADAGRLAHGRRPRLLRLVDDGALHGRRYDCDGLDQPQDTAPPPAAAPTAPPTTGRASSAWATRARCSRSTRPARAVHEPGQRRRPHARRPARPAL